MNHFLQCITGMTLLSFLMAGCSQAPDAALHPQSFDTASGHFVEVENSPVVDIEISMPDSVFSFGDSLPITIILKNSTDTVVKLLFDKPVTTGSPWNTFVTLTDALSGKSVVKLGNLGVLSSQTYSEKDLEPYRITLAPGQSYSKDYDLSAIVIFDTEGYDLHRGTYDLQLLYYSNKSNTIRLTVK
jgi:hypothetical protein